MGVTEKETATIKNEGKQVYMKKKNYRLEKAITTNNSNCDNCSLQKKCPYEDKRDCFEYNNSSVMKGGIENELE